MTQTPIKNNVIWKIIETLMNISLNNNKVRNISMDNIKYRMVYLNNSIKNQSYGYCNNVVITSKYTMITFLPKFLFETFRKLANIYFLIISILQTIPEISNTNGQPSTLPSLLFIIAVDACFAILEDYKRHVADSIANARCIQVLDTQKQIFIQKKWADILVGDIIQVSNWEIIPADLIILAISMENNNNNICYVETKSLDGETNLKVKTALRNTKHICEIQQLIKLKGVVECEQPNNSIHSFQGVITLKNDEEKEKESKLAIPFESIIMRGCILRNTSFIYGLVIHTGKETKIMMNNTSPPSKSSVMDHMINKCIATLIIILLIFCTFATTLCILWEHRNGQELWYLNRTMETKVTQQDWVIQLLYYLLLLYQFVPISLCVSISMVKYAQAIFIQWDQFMYYEPFDTPALVRTMNLNEELGQISYIFSDKTGTLTSNIMEFRKCSIGGIMYGRGTTEVGRAALRRKGLPVPEEESSDELTSKKAPYVNFDAPELIKMINDNNNDPELIHVNAFFTHLALCHSVICDRNTQTGEIVLSASSPDEQALVACAASMGYEFLDRSPNYVSIKVLDKIYQFQILEVLEFNSTRKRMTTILRLHDGAICLFTKGADIVMMKRLKQDQAQMIDITQQHLNDFASGGLRTLVIAKRVIKPQYYEGWSKRYIEATNDLVEIEKRSKGLSNRIDDCMEELEVDFELLGATAVEDKLQEGVCDTIENFGLAGIKIWVLTGDKEETAINIGFACQLLTTSMKIYVINAKKCEISEDAGKELTNILLDIEIRLSENMGSSNTKSLHPKEELALVIDGDALFHALKPIYRATFAKITKHCKAVIACRVSPAQKAQMVALVKEFDPIARTLAIGDGANDVSMIQQAHVGVGISGMEGMQAVNSSDYAISRFHFLERLLLVHGRSNYQRAARLVVYMFYKNILLTAGQFWYIFFCGYSGQKLFMETGVQLYNICFTAAPIIFLSILDKDLDDNTVLAFPNLYKTGRSGEALNFMVFYEWIFSALLESAIISLITFAITPNSGHDGTTPTMQLSGNTLFTVIVWVANGRLMLFQQRYYWFTGIIYLLSFLSWVLVIALVSEMSSWTTILSESMFKQLIYNASVWLVFLLAPVASLWYIYFGIGMKLECFPEYWQIIREGINLHLSRKDLIWESDSQSRPTSFLKIFPGMKFPSTKIFPAPEIAHGNTNGLQNSPSQLLNNSDILRASSTAFSIDCSPETIEQQKSTFDGHTEVTVVESINDNSTQPDKIPNTYTNMVGSATHTQVFQSKTNTNLK